MFRLCFKNKQKNVSGKIKIARETAGLFTYYRINSGLRPGSNLKQFLWMTAGDYLVNQRVDLLFQRFRLL